MRKITIKTYSTISSDEIICDFCSIIIKRKNNKRHLCTKRHIKKRNFVLDNHEKHVNIFKEDLKLILI